MDRTRFLLRTSAIYAFIGVMIGSHMAGSGDYVFRAIHAHILVVGWLSLFSFAIFYRLFSIPASSVLAKIHVWTSFLGTFGLTVGMWLYYANPIPNLATFNLLFFIIGGSVLFLGFFAFLLIAFVHGKHIHE
ncbi:hypothetical protein [Caldalkalibacillus salinus]|uniref:hypothetical protein n=1 Tax=Caldalkalibacillus salinus TaxID=2803787 RepID=UPI0019214249|nr:hypothetical protein [Caldalkalibacillus salinus]